ncbi:MAG TPA: hypothetical protein VH600_09620 [Burkholderiales bacterium]|jgi:hypothetical protein
MKLDSKNYAPPDPAQIEADNPEALRFWARTLELEKVKQELGIGGPG